MTTVTVPDVDTVDHLDWTLVCQVKNCRFGHPPATHIGIPPSCPHSVLLCTGSAKLAREKLRDYEVLTCAFCGIDADTSLVRIEPLP
jgi:hypothetical protein